ncbi:hypothetical protein COV82_01255 [Candidatus Peregrinibacteria bacterium CG11_big_fil_rev_8_21_14_0_20_46_8]|nr:MAG: hypothetical protein COV82_01255 [Candidatus Peregrinibacteria bacterium CG11_big_fil_rev_8_21_14_0_20_46_8]
MLIQFLILVTIFFFGAAIGSFTSVVIYRLHRKIKGIIRGRSKCTDCSTTLKTIDLIPVLSFIAQRGKCRYCNKDISYMYPLLELITGLLFVALYLKFPFIEPTTLFFSVTNFFLFLLYGIYVFVLIFTFFYDLKYMEIADEILLPAILLGLIATLGHPYTPQIIDALIGGAIGAAFFAIQFGLSKGKWVGLGDVRIGAFMGVILGWQMVLVALFVSYIIGTLASFFIILNKKKLFGVKVPLAPFLVTGTLVTIFYGDVLLGWYLGVL